MQNIKIYNISWQYAPTESNVEERQKICPCAGDPKNPAKDPQPTAMSYARRQRNVWWKTEELHWKAQRPVLEAEEFVLRTRRWCSRQRQRAELLPREQKSSSVKAKVKTQLNIIARENNWSPSNEKQLEQNSFKDYQYKIFPFHYPFILLW